MEDITNTTGTIIWDEPANKNGILEGYEVVMSSNGPQHYIPADCITEPGDTNISVDALTLTSTFTEGLPYFNYTVTVNAVNGAGTGRQSSFEFSTLQSGRLTNINKIRLNYFNLQQNVLNITCFRCF